MPSRTSQTLSATAPTIRCRCKACRSTPSRVRRGLCRCSTTGESSVPVNYIHIPNLPKCDGAIYVVGDSMYPLLKSGDIVLYKQLRDIGDVFWGDMYLLSIDIDGEEYVTVKYIQKSDREGCIKLVSQNPHHADQGRRGEPRPRNRARQGKHQDE